MCQEKYVPEFLSLLPKEPQLVSFEISVGPVDASPLLTTLQRDSINSFPLLHECKIAA